MVQILIRKAQFKPDSFKKEVRRIDQHELHVATELHSANDLYFLSSNKANSNLLASITLTDSYVKFSSLVIKSSNNLVPPPTP